MNNVSTNKSNSPDYYRDLYKKYQNDQEKIKEEIMTHISMLSSTVSLLETNITKLNTMNNDVTINPKDLEVFKNITFSNVSDKKVNFANINSVLDKISAIVEKGLKIEDTIKQELGLIPKPISETVTQEEVTPLSTNISLDLNESIDNTVTNDNNFKIKY